MNIIQIFQKFPTQESCIRHLEKARWGNTPVCAYCGSGNTYPLKGELRHHCNACRKSFSVTIGTIFFDTRLPMQKWFLAIALILNGDLNPVDQPAWIEVFGDAMIAAEDQADHDV